MKIRDIKLDYARFKKYYLNVKKYSDRLVVKESLTVALSVFLIAFFLVFALRPTLVKIAELRNKIEESEQTLENLERKSNSLARVSSLWEQASPYLNSLDASLPLQPYLERWVKEIEVLARRNEVNYNSANFDATLIRSDFVQPYKVDRSISGVGVPYSIKVSGEYNDLRQFLEEITAIDRVMSVESLGFVQDENQEEGSLSLTLQGEVYYFADEDLIKEVLKEKR